MMSCQFQEDPDPEHGKKEPGPVARVAKGAVSDRDHGERVDHGPKHGQDIKDGRPGLERGPGVVVDGNV